MKVFLKHVFLIYMLSVSLIFASCSLRKNDPSPGNNSTEGAGSPTNMTQPTPKETETTIPQLSEETDTPDDTTAKNKFPDFKTVDLSGNEVTQAIFQQKKLTMINIWGTFCGPCIKEMPELARLSDEYSKKDVQLIGIVVDAGYGQEAIQDAKDILSAAKADFLNIIPTKELDDYLGQFQYVPTTVFVDSTQKIVGETIVGADLEGYRKQLDKLLEDE